MGTRGELISLGIRIATAAALSYFTVKYMVRFLDPSHAQKDEYKKKVAELFKSLGMDRTVELNEHEMRIATHFVSGEDEGVEWEDVGGCEELVQELKDRVILPLTLERAGKGSALLSPPKGSSSLSASNISGVLLYGPPGCGKTLLAKAVAKASNCRFLNLQVSNLTDKWYGESQKLAAAVFSVAQKFQPTIIFIDEIDSFLRDRQSYDHEATAMMKAQFMSLWDGFASSGDQVIVMGATNRPRDVDAAILRRLSARFPVPMPNVKQRAAILNVILKEENVEGDLSDVAKATEGLSGSDLKEVCRLAVLSRAKSMLEKGLDFTSCAIPLSCKDLMDATSKYSRVPVFDDHNLD